jgi:hypothetical protein
VPRPDLVGGGGGGSFGRLGVARRRMASCGDRWWVCIMWRPVVGMVSSHFSPLPILPRWGPWHSGGLLDGAAALTIGGRRWAGLAVPLPEVVAHGGRQRSAFEDGFRFVIAIVLR